MQDRYAGDVGDFMTFGLLRTLAAMEGGLRLGINWYLTDNESHNGDGRHIGYLQPGSTHHQTLNACDADLMTRLAAVVDGQRSVAALEAAGVLPEGTTTFSEPLTGGMKDGDRRAWHRRALAVLADVDLVFVSPDNGMRASRRGPKASKFAFHEELADYAGRGQSLIVYQHADRSAGGVAVQIRRRLGELAEMTGAEPLGAVITRRGSCRFFIVVPAPTHRDRLTERLHAYSTRWVAHADYVAGQFSS